MTSSACLPPVALTMGEPAGIGAEITLKAWLGRERPGGTPLPPFLVIDDPARLERLAAALGLQVPVRAVDSGPEAARTFPVALPVWPQRLSAEVAPGRPDPENAPPVLASIDRAVALVTAGEAAAVVTNPIHKKTLFNAGFRYPGHTEYLAELAGRTSGRPVRPVMMLACPGLRVVPVTVHLPLKEAVAALDRTAIVACARVTAAALTLDFGIPRPRLVVAALNPHAGEGGGLGSEEAAIIAPAVGDLRRLGLEVAGPAPADTLFHEAARRSHDAVICMYHDQALIPLKTIDFDHGVNITLGLPFVRTSPDHGTALDIAGKGTAREASLIAALEAAGQMARRRATAESRDSVA
jgi:4-hydroxythreonine-4-phosphate dehydrogenase